MSLVRALIKAFSDNSFVLYFMDFYQVGFMKLSQAKTRTTSAHVAASCMHARARVHSRTDLHFVSEMNNSTRCDNSWRDILFFKKSIYTGLVGPLVICTNLSQNITTV